MRDEDPERCQGAWFLIGGTFWWDEVDFLKFTFIT